MKESPTDMRSVVNMARQFAGSRATVVSCVVGLFAFGNVFTSALAQHYKYDESPVLSPNVDFNGVSPTSGMFATTSPLHFAAPSAGRLDLNVTFNCKKNTFNLNIFVEDKTFTRVDHDPNIRPVKVHLGGQDKLFDTRGRSPC